jgi:hypothetical protein
VYKMMDSPEVAATILILIFVVGYWFGYMQCKRRYRAMMEILQNMVKQPEGVSDGVKIVRKTNGNQAVRWVDGV